MSGEARVDRQAWAVWPGARWACGLVVLTLLSLPHPTMALTRCVRGSVEPPPACRTYDTIASAQAASQPGDEVRIYGTVSASSPIVLKARRLTGVVVGGVRATIDARMNPDVVMAATHAMAWVTIKDLDVLMSGGPDNVGLQFSQVGLATVNGVRLYGPSKGMGTAIDILPGAGHVRVFGNTSASVISGHAVGIRATRPASGPELNKVTVTDVEVGMQSHSARIAQWFNSSIKCDRPGSIGFRQIAVDGEDHHLVIGGCSVAIQLECDAAANCGATSEWAITAITTDCLDQPCVPVRAIGPDGHVVDDHRADPACNASWNTSVSIDGTPIAKTNSGRC